MKTKKTSIILLLWALAIIYQLIYVRNKEYCDYTAFYSAIFYWVLCFGYLLNYDFIRRCVGIYDKSGLKYSTKHLEKIKYQIPFWSIEKQAKYVDKIAKSNVDLFITDDKYSNKLKREFCKKHGIQYELFFENDFKVNNPDFINCYNTSGVGNIAYIILKIKDEAIKEHAKKLMEKIKEIAQSNTMEL